MKFDPKVTMVPEYIIWYFQDHGEPITNLKLQKLLYYAQGWYLAIYNEPLFNIEFQAWVHGPVSPSTYHEFKKFKYGPITDPTKKPSLSEKIISHLDEVIEVYGSYSAFELEHLTHQSDPWKIARDNLPPDESSDAIISIENMKTYFKKKMSENEQKEDRREQAK